MYITLWDHCLSLITTIYCSRTESEDDSHWYHCQIPDCMKCCKCKMPAFTKGIQAWGKDVSTKANEIKWDTTAWNEKTQEWNFYDGSRNNVKKETYQQTLRNNWHKLKGHRRNCMTLFGIITILLLKCVKFLIFDVAFPMFDVFTDYVATNTHFE